MQQETVRFDSIKDSLVSMENMEIPIALGADSHGNPVVIDLARCPHLLVGGQTGSGKTAFLDSLVCSVLSSRTADEVMLALIDLKGAEFPIYNGVPHLMIPVITGAEAAFSFLDDILMEIDRRLLMFSKVGVRKLSDYNRNKKKLPHIVIIFDEYSLIMLKSGRKFEDYIRRISLAAGLCGIHLVLSTNRCTADVITGVVKCSMPAQVAFSVPAAINSRIIMDCVGAEKLSEFGEMIYRGKGMNVPMRIHGAYIADSEIKALVESFTHT